MKWATPGCRTSRNSGRRTRSVIGKDILSPPHAIYWPTMLHAMGFSDDEIPQLVVHGWWNLRGGKISKSLGNVIDPDCAGRTFTPDGLRFYLMKTSPPAMTPTSAMNASSWPTTRISAAASATCSTATLKMANNYRAWRAEHRWL